MALVGMGAMCTCAPALAAPPQRHLDLRAPSHVLETSVFPAIKSSLRTFGTAHRQDFTPQEPIDFPALGADGMRSRPRIQELVRRMHQEGLPVARLFESKSALVHLGLSPKGKPGLWLVQKTH